MAALTMHDVIVRPLITEKSSVTYQNQQAYTFEVHPEASKYQIRAAIQALFPEVTVTGVRTMQMRRESVTRGRTRGTKARWKKAIVTLQEGQTLPVYEV
jgi:large subunit ribosomal protein L23